MKPRNLRANFSLPPPAAASGLATVPPRTAVRAPKSGSLANVPSKYS